jgi:hypothetical protein
MKKIFFVLAIFVCAAPLFALPGFSLSAGGGGLFSAQWKDAVLKDEYKEYGTSGGGAA